MNKNIDSEHFYSVKFLMLSLVLEDLVKNNKHNFDLESKAKDRIIDRIFTESNGFNESLNDKALGLIKKNIQDKLSIYVDEETVAEHMEHFFCGGNVYGEDPRDISESYFESYLSDYIDKDINYNKILDSYINEGKDYLKVREPFVTNCFLDYLSENHDFDFDGLKKYISMENIEEYESLGLEIGVLENKKEAKKKKKLKP
jgi:hypothetical protein